MAKLKVIKNRRAYMRRRRIRRFLTLTTIVTIFAYAAHATYSSRMNQIEAVRAELAAYQEQYEAIMLRQDFYVNQVARLQDDDYIAMLARERHFRALPNEVVFRIVDDSSISPIIDTYDDNDEIDDNDGIDEN